MKLPKIDPSTQKTLIQTGISTLGAMIFVSWKHRCARNTMSLAHKQIMEEISYRESLHNKKPSHG